jgi:hypothetical protein
MKELLLIICGFPLMLIFLVCRALVTRFVVGLSALYLKDRDDRVRLDVVRDLGELGSPNAYKMLVKIYKNKDEWIRIRSAALEGILIIKPEWLPDIPGNETAEEFVTQLVTLIDQSGKEFRDQKPVREIGERLYALGGLDLMVFVLLRLQMQCPKARLDIAWDGIGNWIPGRIV